MRSAAMRAMTERCAARRKSRRSRTAARHRRVLVLVRLKDAGEGVDARRVGGAPLDRMEAAIVSGLAAAFLAGVPLAETAARHAVFGSAARGLAGPTCGAANPAPPSSILTAAPPP